MSTGIQWTDETWNPVVGCTKVSQGCKHCYAEELHDKRHKASLAGKAMPAQYMQPFESVQLMPERLAEPLRWKKPRRVFVNSVSDLFHEAVPDGFLVWVWLTMARTPQHTYQILTKRPARMRDFVTRWNDLTGESFDPQLVRGPAETRAAHPSGRGQLFAAFLDELAKPTGGRPPEGAAWPTFDWAEGPLWWPRIPLDNVWLGVSVEDQAAADARIPELLATPAAVRFLSCEPLLGPVDLIAGMHGGRFSGSPVGKLNWVIAGGESGPGARPCDLAWIRSLVAQCRAAGVAAFYKQGGYCNRCVHDRKGGHFECFPEDLRVREFPEVGR